MTTALIDGPSRPLPPGLWTNLQNARYYLYQAFLNPSKARKNLLHKIAPSFFEDPGRKKRATKGKNKNEKGVKLEKADKVIKKKTKLYKFKMKHSRFITEGGFGRLYAADCYLENETGETRWERCAVKKLSVPGNAFWSMINKMQGNPPGYFYEAMQELAVLNKLKDHEFILQLYTDFKRRGTVFLVTELAELGDLSNVLSESDALPQHIFIADRQNLTPRFPAFMVRFIMAPIFSALAHMHAKGYIHRDIKPQNILMCGDGTPKLCDFGTAVHMNRDKDGVVTLNDVDRSQVGSNYYMAPESVCFQRYSRTLDTWQMGISLLVLVFGWGPYHFRKSNVYWSWDRNGHPPPDSSVVTKWFQQSVHRSRSIDREILERVNLDRRQLEGESGTDWRNFRSFAKNCFKRHIEDRPTCAMLCQHEYIAPVLEAWNSRDFSEFRRESVFLGRIVTSMRSLPAE